MMRWAAGLVGCVPRNRARGKVRKGVRTANACKAAGEPSGIALEARMQGVTEDEDEEKEKEKEREKTCEAGGGRRRLQGRPSTRVV